MILATPAIWYPGQSEEEWQDELDRVVHRSHFTQAFLQGQVAVDVFLDFVAEEYGDPLVVAEEWDEWQPLGTFSN